jgi:DNA-binding HxlR family transcriptional regulator
MATDPSLEPADPLDVALNIIGDRWTLLIVQQLLTGPGRFNELMAQVSGIAPNILTKRLRHLETSGILVASAYSDKPVRLHYELTAAGRDLVLAVENLRSWGNERSGGHGHVRHACGTPVEMRPWCPHCETVATASELVGGRAKPRRRGTAVDREPLDWV